MNSMTSINDGLKERYREAILKVLSSNERVERAVLFGSRAMGTFTTTSDIDIALYGDKLTFSDYTRLATEMEYLTVPQRVDLLLYKNLKNDAVRDHVDKHGIEWYSRQ